MIESLLSAVRSVYAYKMRSLLTMLGIIIGIAAVIMITSLGDGVYSAIYDEMASFNVSAIQVSSRNLMLPVLNFDDQQAIENLPNIYAITALADISNQRVTLRNPSETRNGTIWGVDHNYYQIETVTMLYGRFISEQDVLNASNVGILTPEVSLEIFGHVNSVGERIEVNGRFGRYSLTVVGILDVAMDSMVAQTPLNTSLVIIPVSTAAIIRNNPGIVDAFSVSVENPALSMATAEQITRLLNIRHNSDNGFMAISLSTVMDGLDAIFAGITGFIAFVAGISLFVGGVGVMNIMMVTVTERTKEIGIKKALGASGLVIRLQFVFEAVLITSIGGVIGIALGLSGARGLGNLISSVAPMTINATIDTNAIVVAVVVSTLVGLVFGVYPAAKAAKLDPVESLRYE